jgi:hypothetical protein
MNHAAIAREYPIFCENGKAKRKVKKFLKIRIIPIDK